MNWITNKVKAAGAKEEVITLSSVNWMFQAVSHLFTETELSFLLFVLEVDCSVG